MPFFKGTKVTGICANTCRRLAGVESLREPKLEVGMRVSRQSGKGCSRGWVGAAASACMLLSAHAAMGARTDASAWDKAVKAREVLMMAWMNAESLRRTLAEGRMVYWSRSRRELWRKGDTSGDRQFVREAYYDCDGDTLLFLVEQEGARQCIEDLVGRVRLATLLEPQVVLGADPRTDRHLVAPQPRHPSLLVSGPYPDVLWTNQHAPGPEVVPKLAVRRHGSV